LKATSRSPIVPEYEGDSECVDVADLMPLLVRLEGVEDHMDDGDALTSRR